MSYLLFHYIVRSLYFLNPKFQASDYLLWLYSPVCVRPEDRFSHDMAHLEYLRYLHLLAPCTIAVEPSSNVMVWPSRNFPSTNKISVAS